MPFISLENLQLTVQGIQIALKDVWNSVKNKANRSELVQSDYTQYDDSKLDYIKNRTHYDTRRTEKKIFTFDGNTDGKEVIIASDFEIFCKITDETYPIDAFLNGEFTPCVNGIVRDPIKITENSISHDETGKAYIINGLLFIIFDNCTIGEGITLTKGIWTSCRMAQDGTLGFYSSSISFDVNLGELKKLDEKYLPSLQSDWNQNDETASDYVKNRTHYDTRVTEIVTHTFDGNLDAWAGEKVDLNGNGAMYYLKLSDDVPSLTDFVGCTQIAVDDGVSTSITIPEDSTDWYANAGHGIYATNAFVLVTEVVDDFPMAPGLWAICKLTDGVVVSYTVQASYKKVIGELKKIDEKYISDTIMRTPTEDDALELVAELGLAEPMTDDEGKILTDENGILFIL